MIVITTIVGVLSAFITIRWFKNRRYNNLLVSVPSPEWSRIPFVGHLYILLEESKRRKPGEKVGETYFHVYDNLAKEFGPKGICRLHFGPYIGDVVNIYKPEMYKIIMTDNQNISKQYFYYLASDYIGMDNILLAGGNTWKVARKQITPAFHYSILDQFESHFNSNAESFCEAVVDKHFKDAYVPISHYLMKSLIETSLGLSVEATKVDSYLKDFEEYNEIYAQRITSLLLMYEAAFRLLPIGRRCKKIVGRLHKFTIEALQERMKVLKESENAMDQRKKPKKSCLADTLIREHLWNPNTFTLDFIRHQLDTFVFAGHETTSVTLLNVLFLIANYPEVQKRLQEEIDENLSPGEEVTSAIFPKLKYLDAVIKESQRFIPAVSSIGRTLTHDIDMCGYKIPAGTSVMFNFYSLHRDPDNFKDPELFNPDRFMPESEENKSRHPFGFIPFAAGPRNCIGQKFAINELKIFLAKILSKLEVSTSVPMDQVRLTQGLILRISNDVDLKFTRR